LQRQHLLLQHLQKKCQEQQLLLQHEVQMLMNVDAAQNQEGPVNPFDVQDDQLVSPIHDEAPAMTLSSRARRMAQSMAQLEDSNGKPDGTGKMLALTASDEWQSRKRGSMTVKGRSQKRPVNVASQASHLVGPTLVDKVKSEPSDMPKTFEKEDTSLIPFMTKQSIEKHLESLNKRIRLSCRTVTHKCLPLIDALIEDQFGWVFLEAVDPVTLGLPDYFDVVKTPMHLDLVKKKLENAIYHDMETFARDTRLVFENAILYNGPSSEVGELAQIMLNKFTLSYSTLVQGRFVHG
jgi:hypothetical protein